jgi:ankyrin repeat protein
MLRVRWTLLQNGQSALTMAANAGHSAVMQVLLDAGAENNLNEVTIRSIKPLLRGAYSGRCSLLRACTPRRRLQTT